MDRIFVTINPELLEELDTFLDEAGMGKHARSGFIRKAISDRLNQLVVRQPV